MDLEDAVIEVQRARMVEQKIEPFRVGQHEAATYEGMILRTWHFSVLPSIL